MSYARQWLASGFPPHRGGEERCRGQRNKRKQLRSTRSGNCLPAKEKIHETQFPRPRLSCSIFFSPCHGESARSVRSAPAVARLGAYPKKLQGTSVGGRIEG